MPQTELKLKQPAELARIVENYPGIDKNRLNFILAHLQGVDEVEHPKLYSVFEKGMPAPEFDFVKVCFGQAEPPFVPRSGTPSLLLKNRKDENQS